jgi:hypothetical protein
MAYTRIFDRDFNVVYQLRPDEALTDTYLDAHPLGHYWTDSTLNTQQFTAVTTNDDGTHSYQVISAVPDVVICACGHPKGTASWTALS